MASNNEENRIKRKIELDNNRILKKFYNSTKKMDNEFVAMQERQSRLLGELHRKLSSEEQDRIQDSLDNNMRSFEDQLGLFEDQFNYIEDKLTDTDILAHETFYKNRMYDLRDLEREARYRFAEIGQHGEDAGMSIQDMFSETRDTITALNVNALTDNANESINSNIEQQREMAKAVQWNTDEWEKYNEAVSATVDNVDYALSRQEVGEIGSMLTNELGINDPALVQAYLEPLANLNVIASMDPGQLDQLITQDKVTDQNGQLISRLSDIAKVLDDSDLDGVTTNSLLSSLNERNADIVRLTRDNNIDMDTAYKQLMQIQAVSADAGFEQTAISDILLEIGNTSQADLGALVSQYGGMDALAIRDMVTSGDMHGATEVLMNSLDNVVGNEALMESIGLQLDPNVVASMLRTDREDFINNLNSTVDMTSDIDGYMSERTQELNTGLFNEMGNKFTNSGPVKAIQDVLSKLDIDMANAAYAVIVAQGAYNGVRGLGSLLGKGKGLLSGGKGGGLGRTLVGGGLLTKGRGLLTKGKDVIGRGGLLTKGKGLLTRGKGLIGRGASKVGSLFGKGGAKSGIVRSGTMSAGASQAALGGITGTVAAIDGLRDLISGFKNDDNDLRYSGGTKLGLVAGGTATGAAVGSIIPGVGTLVGAGIGAGIGGITSLVKGSEIANWTMEKSRDLAPMLGKGIGKSIGKMIEFKKTAGDALDSIKEKAGSVWDKFGAPAIDGVKDLWDSITGNKDDKKSNTAAKITGSRELITKTIDGSHRTGLDRVPFDGYVAELHKNETVLTANQSDKWRSYQDSTSTSDTISRNIDSNSITRDITNDSISRNIDSNNITRDMTRDTSYDRLRSRQDSISNSTSDSISSYSNHINNSINEISSLSKSISSELIDGSHKSGLSRVPFDGYVAELHKNEAVLTEKQSKDWKQSQNALGLMGWTANKLASQKFSDGGVSVVLSSGSLGAMANGIQDSMSGGMGGDLGIGTVEGSTAKDKVWNFFKTKGFKDTAIAGIMGNIQQESGFDPAIIEKGNGIGLGLAQWSFGRRTELESFARDMGRQVSDVDLQLEFMWKELTGSQSYFLEQQGGMQSLMNASTPDAVRIFHDSFERSADTNMSNREGFARSILEEYQSKGVPQYKVGTPFVPEDQVAIVHKGEAIVPADMNPFVNSNTENVSNVQNTTNNTRSNDNRDIVDALKWAVNRMERKLDETSKVTNDRPVYPRRDTSGMMF